MSDVSLAVKTMLANAKAYERLWNYYDGDQPLLYSTAKLREIFGRIDAKFSQNICAPIINATRERLNLQRFTVAESETASDDLNQLAQKTNLLLDAHDAHLGALVAGESFVVVGVEDGETEAYCNDARMCQVFYDPARPKRKRFAAKWWNEGEKRRLTLYYPDRTEYWISRGKAESLTPASDDKSFEEFQPAIANEKGIIPVFHFRRETRKTKGELDDILPLQDAINKLLNDMMVGSEFSSMPQRFAVTNMEDARFESGSNKVWLFPQSDKEHEPTQVGTFAAANLAQFMDSIDRLCYHAGVISRTPKHYLMAQGGDPSGEALIAMEAPLNKKCSLYIERWEIVWREVAAYLMLLAGQKIDPMSITPVFERPETVQPRTRAEIRNLNSQAGVPLTTQLRDEGWSEQEIADLEKDKAAEQAAEAQTRGQVAASLFDRGIGG